MPDPTNPQLREDSEAARTWRRSYGLPETYADLMAAAYADAERHTFLPDACPGCGCPFPPFAVHVTHDCGPR